MFCEESNVVTPNSLNLIDTEVMELLSLAKSPIRTTTFSDDILRPIPKDSNKSPRLRTPLAKNLAPVFEEIYKKSPQKLALEEEASKTDTKKVVYQNRNILDLQSNITSHWPYQPSIDPRFCSFDRYSDNEPTVLKKMWDEVNERYCYYYPSEKELDKIYSTLL